MTNLNYGSDTETKKAISSCMMPQTRNLIAFAPENKKDFCVLQNVRPVAPDIWEIEERETVNLYPFLSDFKQLSEQVQEVLTQPGKDGLQSCVQEASRLNLTASEPTTGCVEHFTGVYNLLETRKDFEYEILKKEMFIRFLFWILKALFQQVHLVFYIEGKNVVLQIFADEKPFVKIILNDIPFKTYVN